MRAVLGAGVAVVAVAGAAGGASAQNCGNGSDFRAWLGQFAQDAAGQGISRNTISAALANVRYDPKIVALDRRQNVFAQDFLTFAGRMVAKYRLDHGRKHIRQKASLFARIEKQYGVPAPVLVSFWGLETDFGANIGKLPTLTSLATLAYDCRRPELFRKELMSALKIVDRGDLTPEQMVGPWAGEMGQTQFLPTHYLAHGVDFDGDGRRDLLRSSADALASSARFLAHLGWRRGEPWLEEVRVPNQLPWEKADMAIKLPRGQWAQMGVQYANGRAVPGDRLPASLLLPMGRNGPAFLAYHNFDIYLEWNQSLVYATTAAYFATRLAGAPPVNPGRGVRTLNLGETKQLQAKLARAGFDVGKIDGIIGEQTRAAVRAVQIKLGLPADAYPTRELLAAMR